MFLLLATLKSCFVARCALADGRRAVVLKADWHKVRLYM